MHVKRLTLATAVFTAAFFMFTSVSVFASSNVIKKEMQGSEVTSLQKDLKKLGYLSSEPTGYFGDQTVKAVKEMQEEYGYDADGIVGETTLALIDRLLGRDKNTQSKTVSTSSGVLKEGAEGSSVLALQKDLKKLGYFSAEPTGYFGKATAAAVKKLQKKGGIDADGIAGKSTLALVKKLVAAKSAPVQTVAKSAPATATETAVKTAAAEPKSESDEKTNYLLPWFSKVNGIFKKGTVATVYDIDSGLSFKIKRTYGHNHADSEALTAKDTATMKKIFGEWSWTRRAIIITVGDTKIAASMAGMPHAGKDGSAANKVVSSRSGGYGRGQNLDAVKGNNMNGHFDVHFYGSKTHDSNRVDSAHQKMVKKAAEWARDNL